MGSLGIGRLLMSRRNKPTLKAQTPATKTDCTYSDAADACRGFTGSKPRGLGVSTAYRSSSGSSSETCSVRSPLPLSILEGFSETSKESHVPERKR